MSCLDECEAYWNHCDSSVSPSKFNAFSAETEEKIGDLQEQIDNIEVSGVTYSAGANIDITNHIIKIYISILLGNFYRLSFKIDSLDVIIRYGDIRAIIDIAA